MTVIGDIFWVRDAAGSSRPRSHDDMRALADRNIRAILSLTEDSLPAEWVRDFRTLHEPVIDFTAPSLEQLHRCVEFLQACVRDGQTPVVHCTMGQGRTGTVLAAYLIAQGESAKNAIAEVRRARSSAIETDEQESILYDFEIECQTHTEK